MTEAEVRDLALRYLTRREYGVEELRRKLTQRGADSDIAQAVVERCAEENLVSDERFAQMYVRTRMRRLFGPLKIRAELRQRGVTESAVAAAMPDDDSNWFELAAQWAQKRCRGPLDYAGRAKLYRSLVNRGFSHEQANAALDACVPD